MLFENFITDHDAAKECRVHRRTIDRWLDAGLLIGTRIGNQRLIDIEASRAALTARARKASKSGKRRAAAK